MQDVELIEETPGASEYRALRVAAGLSPKTAEAAEQGLPNSLFVVCLRLGGELIGMGRIIGDGGCNLEIVDIAVHPDHQRQGHGYRIMESIMSYLRDNAPKSAYVCLIADHDSPKLYAKFGFKLTTPKSVGMAIQF